MTDENTDYETNGGTERIESLTENLGRVSDSRRGFLQKGVAASAAGLGLSAGAGNVAASSASGKQYVDILNYALTLERLEATFYARGLDEFSEDDLVNSDIIGRFGEPVQSTLYEQLGEIRDHERAHVDALVKTVEKLGGDPVGPDEVEFSFGLDSPEAFIKTAQTLETTGVSAYDGAIDQLSGNDELLTAAATIATVEGRHSAYLNGLTGKSPFPDAFDEPLPPDKVLELIEPFVVSQ